MVDKEADTETSEHQHGATMISSEDVVVHHPSNARASLIVLAGWEIGREIEVHGDGQILGRAQSCSTVINLASISRQHARIDRVKDEEGEHFTITDLGSSNGTRVNNGPTTTTRLFNGDKIRMGDVLFKFVLQDEIDANFHRQVHRLIHYDQLTGLMTMDAFRQRLDSAIRQTGPGATFCLAMTDLDGLKRVNDTHGHLAGRMVVREMGVMMRESIRPQDMAGLYGGDEAIILYPETGLDGAREVAERLRARIADRQFEREGKSFRVTISQGLAEWPRHGETAEALIAAADLALYAAKAAGRNCVRCAGDAAV